MKWKLIKDRLGLWQATKDATEFSRLLMTLTNMGVAIEPFEARLTSDGWQIRREVVKKARSKEK